MKGFAVVDVETTGFAYNNSDRIVEIAIITMDLDGRVQGEWETLVNPKRHLGATHIHRIEASDVLSAPEFKEIVGDVAEQLHGRLVIAHNTKFDLRFLAAEFKRAGYEFPLEADDGFCTMDFAKHNLSWESTKLQDCCQRADIDLKDAHSALGDARATAQLFTYYRTQTGMMTDADLNALLTLSAHTRWNGIPQPSGKVKVRGGDGQTANLMDYALPGLRSGMGVSLESEIAYLDFLHLSLLDEELSVRQKKALAAMMVDAGMSPESAIALHEEYLLSTYTLLQKSNKASTRSSVRILDSISLNLGLDDETQQKIFGGMVSRRTTWEPKLSLTEGDSILFTGVIENKDDLIDLAGESRFDRSPRNIQEDKISLC